MKPKCKMICCLAGIIDNILFLLDSPNFMIVMNNHIQDGKWNDKLFSLATASFCWFVKINFVNIACYMMLCWRVKKVFSSADLTSYRAVKTLSVLMYSVHLIWWSYWRVDNLVTCYNPDKYELNDVPWSWYHCI